MAAVIEVDDVAKSYGNLPALKGVSLSVQPAETFGLLGLNGAGKSTLSRILMGLLRADRGTVRVAGIDPAREPRRVRAKLGYLAEESVLYDELTASEHLETVAALGINVGRLRSLNFAVGIYLAGLSGVLAAGQLGLEPTMGTGLLMPSFIAIIIGGVGSLTGTLIGGLLIGVASGVTSVFLPAASEAIMYVLMAVVLLIRPRGLLGEEGMMT